MLTQSARIKTIAAVCLSCVCAQGGTSAAQSSPSKTTSAIKAAADPKVVANFQTRLNGYLTMRETLAKRLKPLSPTASAADLAARQESLAAAIRSERKGAKPGDLISSAMADYIRSMVVTDFKRRTASDTRAAFEEVAVGPKLAINSTYPVNAALATVPPLLLNKLPKLPDNLQYRFYDRHIVLLDGDTELVTDYILNVLPPLAKGDPDHERSR